MKGIIEVLEISISEKRDLLHTHNLRKLSEVLNKELKIGLGVMGLSFLKDFYFEARYSGDNFSLCYTRAA